MKMKIIFSTFEYIFKIESENNIQKGDYIKEINQNYVIT